MSKIEAGKRVKVTGNELGPDFIGRTGVVTKIHNEQLVTVKLDGHYTATMFTKDELEVIDE